MLFTENLHRESIPSWDLLHVICSHRLLVVVYQKRDRTRKTQQALIRAVTLHILLLSLQIEIETAVRARDHVRNEIQFELSYLVRLSIDGR